MKHFFDCIIAGGGCAGLSLAYHLVEQGYPGEILILDREQKSDNDRTWCWWSKIPTPFDALLTHEWHTLGFADINGLLVSSIAPYRYCLLRSAAFYQFIHGRLAQCANVTFRQVPIDSIEDGTSGATVFAGQVQYKADWVFSSIPITKITPATHSTPHLLQHFMGWWIEVDQDLFDPQSATLMDFRVEQQNSGRFVYTLPITKRRALIEYTVFSKALLSETDYQHELKQYIRNILGVDQYRICETEFGVIPMRNIAAAKLPQQHVVSIGTPGGAVKASTGYAFARIQEQTQQIARQMVKKERPTADLPRSARFAFYDRLLLQILSQRGGLAAGIFSSLFRQVPFPLILKFMDEKTWVWEDLMVLGSLPPKPFLEALLVQQGKVNNRFSRFPKPINS